LRGRGRMSLDLRYAESKWRRLIVRGCVSSWERLRRTQHPQRIRVVVAFRHRALQVSCWRVGS
jgi:hypothetical protein